jgi:hypothetical protein
MIAINSKWVKLRVFSIALTDPLSQWDAEIYISVAYSGSLPSSRENFASGSFSEREVDYSRVAVQYGTSL